MSAEILRAYYRAFNAQDYAAMLALVSDDVVHDVNQGERELGRAPFAAFLARMHRAYREQIRDLVVMTDESAAYGAAEFTVEGEYLEADSGFPAAHGQRYRRKAGAFFEFAQGRITRVTTYYNLREWLQQVGDGA